MKKYFLLMRLDKPIGFMLLFWPCAWGFAIISSERSIDNYWLTYLFLFFVGSILMRSAGCVYNDIIDKKIDQKVSRTQYRQLASDKISTTRAWILKCNKCDLEYEYQCSITEDRPEKIDCICGGEQTFDWSQFAMSTILIPERHKA